MCAAVGAAIECVIVHEIGHLGTLKHSPDGLMRDHWTVEQLRDPSEPWTFSSPQSAQLRTAFSAFELVAR